jgi:hypothetical protein
MRHLGDFAPATVLYFMFTTYRPSTGAAFTLAGTPVVRVYKAGSTTQHTTTYSVTADFDSLTGLNYFTIDTSADGTFFAAGGVFNCVLEAGTVDSVSIVGTVVGSFTLNATAALRPTTAGRTLDVSAGGEAGVDWANVGSPTTTLALTGTTIATTQKVDVETIKTNPVVNGGTITFPSGATLASTTNITGGTITTTTNLTNLPAITANWLTAAGLDAGAVTEIQAGLATAAALTTVEGKVDTVDTVADAIKAKTDSLTFTVAGQVDANIQYVNDVAVTGTGAVGDEWGP